MLLQLQYIAIDKVSKLVICNLSKGLIGEDVLQILGSLLTTGL